MSEIDRGSLYRVAKAAAVSFQSKILHLVVYLFLYTLYMVACTLIVHKKKKECLKKSFHIFQSAKNEPIKML